jgi:hypothetical protein
LFWFVIAPVFVAAVASTWQRLDSLALMVLSLPLFAIAGAAIYTLVVDGPRALVHR